MWIIRFFNGPLVGQIIQLKSGSNTLGRAADSDILINHSGVSKRHCKIDVFNNEVLINDLESRNGTFVNGLKIKSHRIEANDKLAFYDIMAEVIEVADASLGFLPNNNSRPQGQQNYQGNLAYEQEPEHQPLHQQTQDHSQHVDAGPFSEVKVERGLQGFLQLAQKYFDDVVMPGIYKLAEIIEFRWLLMIFMGGFIVLVTTFSVIPLLSILRLSIEKESQSHALTIARFIAKTNQPTLLQGMESAVTVDFALNLRGVEKAYIMNMDGRILAPPFLAGKFSSDKFVHTARREVTESVAQIDNGTIGALVPIKYYNTNTGSQSVMAYSVVIYDMGVLESNDKRTVSLFVQTLFIALLFGSILFFFMYRLIKYPITSINRQLDTALREGHNHIEVNYDFKELQDLISNISSALTRVGQSSDSSMSQSFEADRSQEMTNVVQLIGFPAIAIQAHDHTVSAVNTAFEEKTAINSSDILYGRVTDINDQSLKLSIDDIIIRLEEEPDQMITNELEFGGVKHEIVGQTVMGAKGVAYILVVILPAEDNE